MQTNLECHLLVYRFCVWSDDTGTSITYFHLLPPCAVCAYFGYGSRKLAGHISQWEAANTHNNFQFLYSRQGYHSFYNAF